MHYYIVRNKITGKWLTEPQNRNKTSATLSDKKPPRLFRRERDARRALTWWLEGEFFMRYRSATWLQPEEYDLEKRSVEGRHKEEMEVCVVSLVLGRAEENDL